LNDKQLRVAILGGTGFVGHSVRDLLQSSGMQVEVFSKTSGCDLLDLHGAWNKLDQYHPDFIVNCAALVGSVNYVTDFAADVVDVNMRMILNVYKIAQNLRTAVVLNPIANCAYPGVMDLYEEAALWDGPIHPSVLSYGATRRMMWVLSKCYFDQFGVRSINLIVPNMYGPFDSTNPNKTHALNALVIKFIRAVKYGDPEVEVWGTGKPIREWLYVKDFAAVVRRVIEERNFALEPVNIGQRTGCTVTELVDLVQEITGFKGRILYNTKYQDGSPKKVMDDRQFRRRCPDFVFTDIRHGLQETVGYYEQIL
jgi:GDP-L-fucose synthase